MGIMTRFIQLCRADIHGVMDQIEDKGLLMDKEKFRKRCLEDDLKERHFQGVAGALKELMKNPTAAEVIRFAYRGLFLLRDNPEGMQTLIGMVACGLWPQLEEKG